MSTAEVASSLAQPFTAAELEAIRADFPILSRHGRGGRKIAYFDAAATSHKPNRVIDAEAEFYRNHNAAVNRGTHLLGDEATEAFESARATVANFVGGRPDEIVWTKNSTEGLNLVAYSFSWLGPQDRIVITRAEHHSNLVPWQQLAARTGAELRWLDLTSDGCLDLDTLDVITPNTKVVAFTHASNVTGAVSPVAEVVAAARQVGALTVLDTCQSSAHQPVNVSQLGVDFAVFSSHKMLGPTGIGALWGRRELLADLPPFLTGGSVVADVTMETTEFLPAPNRFEAGSQPVAQAAAWAEALRYLQELGMDRVAAQEHALLQPLFDGISEIPGVRILGPATTEGRLGVVAFAVEGVHPHDVGQVLDADDVAVRVGHHCAIPLHRFFGVRSSSRASLSVTNTVSEIEQLIAAIAKVRQYFGYR
ncbi:SufS family cysteine desulfurase [Actinomyces sp. F1_1611]